MTHEVFEAIANGDDDAIDRLLRDESNVAEARDDAGLSPTLFALYHRKIEVAERLAAAARTLDIGELVALGRESDVRRILETDSNALRARSADGFTPLHYAAFFGHDDLAALLIARGADVAAEADNPSRVQPLHSATAAGAVTTVRALLDAGAPVNARQVGGFTALHAAAHGGRADLVDLLVARGATLDLATDDGKTAADLARLAGHDRLAGRL